MDVNDTWSVTIPEWENYYLLSNKTMPKYWLWKDRFKLPLKYQTNLARIPLIKGKRAFCKNEEGERLLKNTRKVGTPNKWILNGQDLYSGKLHHTQRSKMVEYFHNYFGKYVDEQLQEPIALPEGYKLSISCEIYEILRTHIPDVSNMWILEKMFEDVLQIHNIIASDAPDIVRESGRKKYNWVTTPEERKLVFIMTLIKD